ncbi:hypothetical protein BD626DRAFT_156263 [Schizophyllum amplum]|uniref:Uncharacterized protein n=1 Tax=Schizophyllum amplum TaxID=97359 RepID=A0A550BRJ2_9AGAR|nr:hypothetical protein BD626DRAFT_156263 [Auriculariopsis ampla]
MNAGDDSIARRTSYAGLDTPDDSDARDQFDALQRAERLGHMGRGERDSDTRDNSNARAGRATSGAGHARRIEHARSVEPGRSEHFGRFGRTRRAGCSEVGWMYEARWTRLTSEESQARETSSMHLPRGATRTYRARWTSQTAGRFGYAEPSGRARYARLAGRAWLAGLGARWTHDWTFEKNWTQLVREMRGTCEVSSSA